MRSAKRASYWVLRAGRLIRATVRQDGQPGGALRDHYFYIYTTFASAATGNNVSQTWGAVTQTWVSPWRVESTWLLVGVELYPRL